MEVFAESACAFFIVIGGVFLFVGSWGLAKLPDTMRRLHGPTKATTLGVGSLLIASILYFVLLREAAGIHEVLITLFLFLTAPVSANMIAKAHIFRNQALREGLPADAGGSGWATLGVPAGSHQPRLSGGHTDDRSN
jgi:multicomponent K+:H+ antiporter subunit G